jgi:hypothetical protein
MSSRRCRCTAIRVFRGEGVDVTFDASSSEAEVGQELNGLVPTAAIEQQVSE